MSGSPSIAITGASGFIGRAIVDAAVARGLTPLALRRRAGDALGPGIKTLALDLANVSALAPLTTALTGIDTLIHAAGSLSGDPGTQASDTHHAGQTVIKAAQQAGIAHVILISTVAVYDVMGLADGGTLDEATPLEVQPHRRDTYARAKIALEKQFRDAAEAEAFKLTILRPGAVFGPNRVINAHIGPGIGPMLLRIGAYGEVPLCHIDTCASAAVAAVAIPPATWDAINLVEDDLPDRRRFVTALRASGWPKIVLPVPRWPLLLMARVLPDSDRLPGLLRTNVQAARFKPLKYTNKRLHERLCDVTMMPFERAMQQAMKQTAPKPGKSG